MRQGNFLKAQLPLTKARKKHIRQFPRSDFVGFDDSPAVPSNLFTDKKH